MFASAARLQLVFLALLAAGCGDDGTAPATACGAEPAHPIQRVFVVSTTGDDAAGQGTRDAPFRTLGRARDAVRVLAPAMTGDLVVAIEPGDYVLDAPLELDERDSGTNGFVVSYRAAGAPGSVRLLGGAPITGWTPYAGPILAAHVDHAFHTLYEDGVRADEARYPDRQSAPERPVARGGYLVAVAGSSDRLQYAPGDLPDTITDATGLSVVVWSGAGRAWFTDVVPVRTIDHAAHELELAHPTRYELGAGARYFLQGPLPLLDAPGEFALDQTTGTLYYWPRSPVFAEIVAPALASLVVVRGSSPATPVHDLELRGLHLQASDFTAWYRFGWPGAGDSGEPHDVPAFDRQLEMPEHRRGMITLENTERVAIVQSWIDGSGYGGIYLAFANQHDCIAGNLVEHTGIAGIALQGRYPGEGDVSHGNVIANNLIHHVGELAGNGAGIDISNSGDNLIANDWIHDSPRYGVLVHAIANTPGALLYAERNDLHDLEVDATCQDSGDTAALYTFGLSNDGTRSNAFRRIGVSGATPDPSMHDLPPDGVFTDNDSGGQLFEDIRVTGVPGAAFRSNTTAQRFANVSWLPGYDDARLGTIGLAAGFPSAYLDR